MMFSKIVWENLYPKSQICTLCLLGAAWCCLARDIYIFISGRTIKSRGVKWYHRSLGGTLWSDCDREGTLGAYPEVTFGPKGYFSGP